MTTMTFTSSRVIPTSSKSYIDRVLGLLALRAGTDPLYITGACIGGDQYISTTLLELDPHARQRIVVPWDLSRVNEEWLARMEEWPNIEIVRMSRGTDYRDRNLAMLDVDGAKVDSLIAFPLYSESDRRSCRSGTWQTVRMARMRKIRIIQHVLLPAVAA